MTATGLVEGNLASPVAGAGERAALRHAVPDRHRAQRRPVARRTPTTTRPRRRWLRRRTRDNTPSADFANQPAGTYDDEMLNAHFACGDGRCNENIALSARSTRSSTPSTTGWSTTSRTCSPPTPPRPASRRWRSGSCPVAQSPDGWNGERLFQAARFVTEMEYQHLVFEEFARKVQPAVRPFHVYTPGHQPGDRGRVRPRGLPLRPLDARRRRRPHQRRTPTAAKTDNSLPLLTAFLNPPEFFNDGQRRHSTRREQAAGSDRHGLVRPDRQRARRVRHRDAAQQPARPAARPADAQHDPGS